MPTFAPGHRLAYDRDGSAVYRYDGAGQPVHPLQSEYKNINNEDDDGIIIEDSPNPGGTVSLCAVVTPAPVHLVGMYFASSGGLGQAQVGVVEASTDSTNGQNGTWATIANESYPNAIRAVLPSYRDLIYVVNLPGVTSVRARNVGSFDATLRALHLYVASQVTFLKLWHPTLDQEWEIDTLDYGAFYAGDVDVRSVRIKNIRGLTAQGVILDTLTHTGAAHAAYYSFSLDGSNWFRPLDIGDIPPGGTSPEVQIRYAPPTNAPVSRYATQVSAIPTAWV